MATIHNWHTAKRKRGTDPGVNSPLVTVCTRGARGLSNAAMLYDTSGWQCVTHTQWPSAALRRQGRQKCHALHCGRRPLGVSIDHPCGSQWSTPRGTFPAVRLSLLPGSSSVLLNNACCERHRAGEPPQKGHCMSLTIVLRVHGQPFGQSALLRQQPRQVWGVHQIVALSARTCGSAQSAAQRADWLKAEHQETHESSALMRAFQGCGILPTKFRS